MATLFSDAATPTANPAVTLRSVGGSGHAAAFVYDLARSVVYTRQGNPAWAATERDGSSPIRPNDLFFPDYVTSTAWPSPRRTSSSACWPTSSTRCSSPAGRCRASGTCPSGRKAVIVHALDDHNTGSGTRETFDKLDARSPAGCSVADWPCLRATSWGYTGISLTDAQAADYQARGFELGVHVNTNCQDWTPASLQAAFANDLPAYFVDLPVRGAAAQQPHALHRLERLGDAAQGRAGARHPLRHELLLLAGELGRRPAGLLHGLGDSDALRRPGRHAASTCTRA